MEDHEAHEGQCESLKLEGEQLMLEGSGLKFEEARGEKLRGHETGEGQREGLKLEDHETCEGLKLMHEDPKLAELGQGLAGHEWPEVSGLAGDAGGGRAPLSPS